MLLSHPVHSINDFNPTPEKPFVLGLPTGSSPIQTYKALIRMVKEGELSLVLLIPSGSFINSAALVSRTLSLSTWMNTLGYPKTIQSRTIHSCFANSSLTVRIYAA